MPSQDPSSLDAGAALARLRDEPAWIRELVELLMDDLLSRPVHELVDPVWLAERVVEGFRASATDDRTELWVRQQIDLARARAARETGAPRERLSPELVGAARDLIRRPYVPDRQIVAALMDHEALRALTREILYTALLDFGRKLRAPASGLATGRGLGRTTRLSRLVGVATEVAGVVGEEMERQLEGKVKVFVDGAINKSVTRMVDHLCAPERAEELGDWRADSLDVLLDTSIDHYLLELDKLDPEGLVADLAALFRAIARSEGLTAQVQAALEAAVEEAGGRSARDFLEGSGLEEGWRPHLEALIEERAMAFVREARFEDWIQRLLASDGAPGVDAG